MYMCICVYMCSRGHIIEGMKGCMVEWILDLDMWVRAMMCTRGSVVDDVDDNDNDDM